MIRVKIKEAAQARDVETPTKLARMVKCAPNIIWRYWEGHQIPGLVMLDKIATALDCELSDLIVRNGKKRRK